MFDVLRKRMLALTMGLISIVIVAAVVAVYLASELAVNQTDEMRFYTRVYALHGAALSSAGVAGYDDGSSEAAVPAGAQDARTAGESSATDLPPSDGTDATEGEGADAAPFDSHFSAIIFADGTVEVTENASRLDGEALDALVADASPEAAGGVIHQDGRLWRYVVSQVPAASAAVNDGSQSASGETGEASVLTFLDTTPNAERLQDLATRLVIVSALALLAAWLVSWIISSRTIRPAKAAWERERQFVADASHELKTPLAIVCSNYDVLAANSDQTVESQRRWMDGIRYGTDRMESLIDDLLALSRAEEGQDGVSSANPSERFDFGALAHAAVHAYAARAAEKDVALVTAIASDIEASGNRKDAEQIVDVLMDNALKYVDAHGTVEVTASAEEGRAVFRVANTGPTIEEGDLPHVFDRFWRADRSRAEDGPKGYGLGLSIANACATRLGGTLTAQSAHGTTTFELTLPR